MTGDDLPGDSHVVHYVINPSPDRAFEQFVKRTPWLAFRCYCCAPWRNAGISWSSWYSERGARASLFGMT